MNMRNFYVPLVFMLVCMAATGCKDSSPDEPTPPAAPMKRTVLVYMESNNNLSKYADMDLEEMARGMAAVESGRLLVFHHTVGSSPRLIEIGRDGRRTELKTYESDPSPLTIERMRQVIDDVKHAAPASNYGLVMWSHATGWLNDSGIITEDPDLSADPKVSPLSFGVDQYPSIKRMSIASLERALRGHRFDFIYFDCCHMATVEVAYELRDVTPYIVASPTELGVNGMPYDLNLKPMFAPTPDLAAAMRQTFDSYKGDPFGCTITLISTAPLGDLAHVSREVLARGNHTGGYQPWPYFRTIVMKSGIYDMYDYFNHLSRNDEELRNRWNETFSRVVAESHTTPVVYYLDASKFHGLGVNILSETVTPQTYGYDQTRWYADVEKDAY